MTWRLWLVRRRRWALWGVQLASCTAKLASQRLAFRWMPVALARTACEDDSTRCTEHACPGD